MSGQGSVSPSGRQNERGCVPPGGLQASGAVLVSAGPQVPAGGGSLEPACLQKPGVSRPPGASGLGQGAQAGLCTPSGTSEGKSGYVGKCWESK